MPHCVCSPFILTSVLRRSSIFNLLYYFSILLFIFICAPPLSIEVFTCECFSICNKGPSERAPRQRSVPSASPRVLLILHRNVPYSLPFRHLTTFQMISSFFTLAKSLNFFKWNDHLRLHCWGWCSFLCSLKIIATSALIAVFKLISNLSYCTFVASILFQSAHWTVQAHIQLPIQPDMRLLRPLSNWLDYQLGMPIYR